MSQRFNCFILICRSLPDGLLRATVCEGRRRSKKHSSEYVVRIVPQKRRSRGLPIGTTLPTSCLHDS